MKKCNKCLTEKVEEDFPFVGNGKRKGYCKECLKKQRLSAALRNPVSLSKTCRTCKHVFDIEHFLNKGNGFRSNFCRTCYSQRRRERLRANGLPPLSKTVNQPRKCTACLTTKAADQFYLKGNIRNPQCIQCVLVKRKDFWNKEKDRIRLQRISSKYGISVETISAMFERQKQSCAICNGQATSHKGWCVDHDHKTGKVRGILCAPCNFMLGNAKDSAQILLNAVDYLKSNSTPF